MKTIDKVQMGIQAAASKLMKYSKKKLKKQQIYLNNDVVSDDKFIQMVNEIGVEEFYINFPSDTKDKKLLTKYILHTEAIFLVNGIEFNSFLLK